ncbi:MAG: V-type ATP synthase subunit E [Pseudomonadota bacterium]
MPLFDQVELLCQAMGGQAREEADKIVANVRDEAARLVAAAEARRVEVLGRTRSEVETHAKLEARNRLDRAELESKRQMGQTKEAIIRQVFNRALAQLQDFRQSPDYQDWLSRMLLATLKQLEGQQFQVVAPPEEAQWLTPELLTAVGREAGAQLTWAPDEDAPLGGFLLVRADGKVRYDMTFQGIIERQRENLRAELAQRLWGS